jgi:hypothetical protein
VGAVATRAHGGCPLRSQLCVAVWLTWLAVVLSIVVRGGIHRVALDVEMEVAKGADDRDGGGWVRVFVHVDGGLFAVDAPRCLLTVTIVGPLLVWC